MTAYTNINTTFVILMVMRKTSMGLVLSHIHLLQVPFILNRVFFFHKLWTHISTHEVKSLLYLASHMICWLRSFLMSDLSRSAMKTIRSREAWRQGTNDMYSLTKTSTWYIFSHTLSCFLDVPASFFLLHNGQSTTAPQWTINHSSTMDNQP